MVDLWKQEPYWWLHSDELIAACRGSSNIKDFWFKLWHALDKWKTDANRRKHRIHAAHEIQPIPIPSMTVDHHLRDQIIKKITDNISVDELRPWQSSVCVGCTMASLDRYHQFHCGTPLPDQTITWQTYLGLLLQMDGWTHFDYHWWTNTSQPQLLVGTCHRSRCCPTNCSQWRHQTCCQYWWEQCRISLVPEFFLSDWWK